jgi:serine/threonine protein kinase
MISQPLSMYNRSGSSTQETFDVVHRNEKQLKERKKIQKKRPTKSFSLAKPIWCKELPNPTKRQVEKFYQKRLESLDNLMTIENVNGRYQLNLDFINYYADYFYIDNDCICKDLLKNATRIGGGKVGVVYGLGGNAEERNFDLIVKQIKDVDVNLYLSLRIYPLTNDIIERNYSFYVNSVIIYQKGKDDKITRFIEQEQNKTFYNLSRYNIQVPSDDFTNQTLLHMILNQYLGENTNYVYQYDSFYCLTGNRMDGYNVTSFANASDLSNFIEKIELNENLILDMIVQIMTPLYVLKHPKIGFLHSDLKPKNIFVNEAQDGTYQFKLADFDKSSIFYRNIRFFNDHFNLTLNKKVFGLFEINKVPFPLRESNTYPSYLYYSMKDSNFFGKVIGFHEFIMFNPHGFYSSFDIYTFFYSLIIEPNMYMWMMSNQNSVIWSFYSYLFHSDEPEEWNNFLRNIYDVFYGNIKAPSTPGSMQYYWQQFKDSGFKLRYDVNKIYEMLGINMRAIQGKFPLTTLELIQTTEPLSQPLYMSKENHLCLIEPDVKKETECTTNVFSKRKGFTLRPYMQNYDRL